jgi:hypothetical protein
MLGHILSESERCHTVLNIGHSNNCTVLQHEGFCDRDSWYVCGEVVVKLHSVMPCYKCKTTEASWKAGDASTLRHSPKLCIHKNDFLFLMCFFLSLANLHDGSADGYTTQVLVTAPFNFLLVAHVGFPQDG